jgi:hypothetical protein
MSSEYRSAVDGLAFDDGEPDLDQVQPGSGGQGEVDADPGVAGEPGPHVRVLVGGIVVHHQVQLTVGVGPGDGRPGTLGAGAGSCTNR